MKNTVVINLFAGPGAGKSTCAWEIASTLKKLGYVAEYVPEYAKELVWDENFKMLDGSYQNHKAILDEQTHRVDRLYGKVDFIVCDSPIMLNANYFKGAPSETADYEKMVYDIFSNYNNFSIFINREKNFEQAGRIQNLQESKQIDEDVKSLLKKHNIYYGSYFYKTIPLVIDNCIYTYNRINNLQTPCEEVDDELEQ